MTPDLQRLETEAIIWLATVRSDGRPHLTPIWFVWQEVKSTSSLPSPL